LLEVLGLVADRLRTDIGERLFLSRRTVDHHVSAIRRKLGARTRGEAVAAAAIAGCSKTGSGAAKPRQFCRFGRRRLAPPFDG